MDNVIHLPADRASERLLRLIAAGRIDAAAASLGTPEEWGWSAVVYLKDALTPSRGGSLGGNVLVSAAAISATIELLETYALRLGMIE